MKAITVGAEEGGYPLRWTEQADPAVAENQVLIEVHATALNRADLLQRIGKYPPPPGASPILGLECAGTVQRCGVGANRFKIGDRVAALLTGGGYAELVAVPESGCIAIPPSWSFEEGAALPEAFITAYLNLFILGELKPGARVLIHAGASGVGCAAIQLARERDCEIFTTVGSAEKAAATLKLGAKLAINYKEKRYLEEIKGATKGEGVDLILNLVGANYLADDLELLRVGGREVCLSTIGGFKAELDLRKILFKRIKIIGSTLRGQSEAAKAEYIEKFLRDFGEALQTRKIVPLIDYSFSVDKIEQAHQRMRDNLNLGKIVVRLR